MSTAGALPPVLVLGTDFSEGAAAALLEARRLQSWMRVPLLIVHVTQGDPAEWAADPPAANWLREYRVDSTQVTVRHGPASVELVRYAELVGASALVVGSHGQSGFQPVRLGSTAERVTAIAGCPVLIVNPRSALRPLGGAASRSSGAHRALQDHSR